MRNVQRRWQFGILPIAENLAKSGNAARDSFKPETSRFIGIVLSCTSKHNKDDKRLFLLLTVAVTAARRGCTWDSKNSVNLFLEEFEIWTTVPTSNAALILLRILLKYSRILIAFWVVVAIYLERDALFVCVYVKSPSVFLFLDGGFISLPALI